MIKIRRFIFDVFILSCFYFFRDHDRYTTLHYTTLYRNGKKTNRYKEHLILINNEGYSRNVQCHQFVIRLNIYINIRMLKHATCSICLSVALNNQDASMVFPLKKIYTRNRISSIALQPLSCNDSIYRPIQPAQYFF